MPTTKTLQWPGSTDALRLTADQWEGSQTVFIESPENFGNARQAVITFYSENSNRGAAVAVQQAAYTVEVSLSSLTFTNAETTAKQIEIITNGSELKDLSIALTGANADKFTYTTPTLQSTTPTETSYLMEVQPVGVNSGNDPYAATLSLQAGNLAPVEISVVQNANSVVSVTYSNFAIASGASGYTISVPTNVLGPTVRASGDTLALSITNVYCTRTELLADGTTRVQDNYLYSGTEWECKGQLGVPARLTFENQITANGALSLACPNLQNTPYTQADEEAPLLYIQIRPAGSSYEFGPLQTIYGGTTLTPDQSWYMENNTSTYSDASAIAAYLEGTQEEMYEIAQVAILPAAALSGVAIYLTATATKTWTSGYSEDNTPIEVVGQNTDSGIPTSQWLSGVRSWPYSHPTLGNCTRVGLTFTTNTGPKRELEAIWQTTDVGSTQALRMTMGLPQTKE